MPELIYNIKNIFSTENSECCLVEYEVEKFHIAAYQRGYKWSSDEYGAVTILLNDLWDAFKAYQRNERKEYYLQYITLKRNSELRYLEVIDGQQRLTTLSVLLSTLSLKLENENISKNKLDYAIRSNFFNRFIYDHSNLRALLDLEWQKDLGLVISEDEVLNTQDVFYLFSAAKKINNFLSQSDVYDQLPAFSLFVLSNVKIIVNAVDYVSSEKVFGNLNSNKVALTEAELIKGLLLTKFSRYNEDGQTKKHFREILEMRMALGRQWDEITRWSNQPQIKSFFFKGSEGMDSLLNLVAISKGYKQSKKVNSNDYPLFNFFHKYGKYEEVYEQLIKFYNLLNDWFVEDKTYNLFGFLFFSKGSNKEISDFLPTVNYTKSELLVHLVKEAKLLIPTNPDELFYGNNQDAEIHRVLLAINIFLEGSSRRFNFHRFIVEKWTLEHIFPQTPEGKKQELEEKDKQLILEMLGDNVTGTIKKILAKKLRTPEEKDIYETALKGVGALNSIGNMCLLTDKDNISNGCDFFERKRTNILERIRKGSFVPQHTFDVFSKMIFTVNPGDFERWTSDNIDQHKEIITGKVAALKFV